MRLRGVSSTAQSCDDSLVPLTDAPHARAVLATFVVNTISELGVTLALRADEEWYTLTTSPNVLRFELELGVEARRWPYNDDCFARARREGKPIWGHHAGFTDLFVPLCNQSEAWGILVAGPMATSRPTAEEVSLRWKWMGGQSSQPADSRFSDYLSATLATLTLDGADRNAFELLLRHLSQILSGEGEPAVFLPELTKLREALREVRFAEKMWDAVRGMTDARTSHVWGTRFQAEDLWQLGLVAPPEHAAVGLLARAGDHVDPVADRIHRDQLQRACVALARKAGAACGRLGDHGIVFVADRHPVDLAKRAAEAGRKLGLTMHIGTEDASVVGLPARYESAHRAAEMALAHAAPLVTVKASASRRSSKLSALRRQILRDVQGRPRVLAARFEQYLEAVTALHGQDRLGSRVALEVFLDHLGEILVAGGALDDKSLDEMESDLGRAVARADTVNDIVAAYRRLMADVEAAMLKPGTRTPSEAFAARWPSSTSTSPSRSDFPRSRGPRALRRGTSPSSSSDDRERRWRRTFARSESRALSTCCTTPSSTSSRWRDFRASSRAITSTKCSRSRSG